jgi:hypothetical protein
VRSWPLNSAGLVAGLCSLDRMPWCLTSSLAVHPRQAVLPRAHFPNSVSCTDPQGHLKIQFWLPPLSTVMALPLSICCDDPPGPINTRLRPPIHSFTTPHQDLFTTKSASNFLVQQTSSQFSLTLVHFAPLTIRSLLHRFCSNPPHLFSPKLDQ